MLKKFDLPKQEAQLKSNLTEAKSKHLRVIKQGESKISKATASLTAAEKRLELKKEQLVEVDLKLKKSKLIAPEDGLVLYPKADRWSRKSQIEEGASVGMNRELIAIPNIAQMKVVIKVPEFHISKVKLGQQAYVTIDTLPEKRFKAKVSKLAVVPDSSDSWRSTGEKFFTVEVLITDPLPLVKPSVSAKAEIIITELKDILHVPLQAVKTEQGKHYCYIKKLGSLEKTEVSIGLMNNNFVEITSGISAADSILLTAPFDQ